MKNILLFMGIICSFTSSLYSLHLVLEKSQKFENTTSLLWRSVFLNDVETVKELIKKGVDINVRKKGEESPFWGKTPLHFSCQRNHFLMAKVLVNAGADLEMKDDLGETALYKSSERGFYNLVKFLIVSGANLDNRNARGQTPLHVACFRGNFSLIDLLVRSGSNVNAIDRDGRHCLFYLLENHVLNAQPFDSKKKVILLNTLNYLFYSGLLLNLKDFEGNTVLHRIAQINPISGDSFALHVLVSMGADLNECNNRGNTPLHELIFSDYFYYSNRILSGNEFNSIQLLVYSGTDVNIRNNDGNTPLHLFFRSIKSPTFNRFDQMTLDLFLNKGFKVSTKNKKGQTILHLLNELKFLCENNSQKQKVSDLIDKVFKYTKVDNA